MSRTRLIAVAALMALLAACGGGDGGAVSVEDEIILEFDDEGGLEPSGVGSGDNMLYYTTPSLMEGLSISISYLPTKAAAQSAVGYSATYTGVEGLSVTYATGDSTDDVTDATVLKGTYAYGPVTVGYSNYEYDTTGTSSDDDVTSVKVSYTVSDELSVSYGQEDIDEGTSSSEYEMVSASYTAGGMTITASMSDAQDIDGTTTTTEDRERWALSASFAF